MLGSMYQRVQTLESQAAGGTKAVAGNPGAAAQAPAAPNDQGYLESVGTVAPVTADDHIIGSPDAAVVLIEYSDNDCPFCQRFHPTMEQVVEEYGDQVAWVYRQFPLTALHPGAQLEAEATECAAELGGNDTFWAYLDDTLQQNYDQAGLIQLAVDNGLNSNEFQTCLTSGDMKPRVAEDLASGQQAGVNGTPGTIVISAKGGEPQLIPGALPYENVKQIIDAAL